MLQKARSIVIYKNLLQSILFAGIFFFILYSEYYGMANLMKTWLECPECHEWYHKILIQNVRCTCEHWISVFMHTAVP